MRSSADLLAACIVDAPVGVDARHAADGLHAMRVCRRVEPQALLAAEQAVPTRDARRPRLDEARTAGENIQLLRPTSCRTKARARQP
eukprot:3379426-Pleurochrysis_carterae.AAC.3